MTDSTHFPNFKFHSDIINYLFSIIQAEVLSVRLDENMGNREFVVVHITGVLAQNFTNMNRTQIETIVLSLFNRCGDIKEFKQVLRDFLISSKEIAADTEALYTEEREKEIEEAKMMEQQRKAQVPGLLQNILSQ